MRRWARHGEIPRPLNARFPKKFVENIGYPKVQEDYVTGSTAGADYIITFVCAAICALLFLSEYAHHRTTTIASEVKVDTVGVDRLVPNADRLRVHIDVTFHALACELITLDTMDQAGEEHHDVHEGHLKKRRLDRHGEPIEKEYTVEPANKHKVVHEELEKMRKASSGDDEGHQGHTMTAAATVAKRRLSRSALATTRTRTDVRTAATAAVTRDGGGRRLLQSGSGAAVSQQDAMQAHMMKMFSLQALIDEQFPEGVQKAFKNEREEGCEVIGHLEVNRVPGSFSVSPRARSRWADAPAAQRADRAELDAHNQQVRVWRRVPWIRVPTGRISPRSEAQPGASVLPEGGSHVVHAADWAAHQLAAVQRHRVVRGVEGADGWIATGGVYFHYELSPIGVDYKETRNSLSEFLTGVCAVVGASRRCPDSCIKRWCSCSRRSKPRREMWCVSFTMGRRKSRRLRTQI